MSNTFKEEEIMQFYNIIGLDEKELFFTRIQLEKHSDEIENLMDLYNISSARYLLPKSSKEIAERYTVLKSIIDDPFWYDTGIKRRKAGKDARTILENASCINVLEENEINPEKNFARTNEVIKTILNGLISSNNISGVEWITKVSNLETILNKKILQEEQKEIRILYELIVLSKLPDTGVDHLIFNDDNTISEEKLLEIIKEKIKNKEKKESKIERFVPKTKKLQFQRPSLKNLKDSYKNE